MDKSKLPVLNAHQNPNARFEIHASVMDRWNRSLKAATSDEEATISIFDVIGQSWDGEGFSDKKCAGILRNLGGRDVTVNINSPGGNLFDGIAIYNQFREYKGNVTVNVIGMAASAASLIAMGADEVRIARSAFFMVHNCWCVAIGNANDFRKIADENEVFDNAMAEMYAMRTGLELKKVKTLLDGETWIGGTSAIDQGFADDYTPADQITEEQDTKASAAQRLDTTLAKAGMPRSERRALIQELKGTPSAVLDGTPSAAFSAADAAQLLALTARFGAAAKA